MRRWELYLLAGVAGAAAAAVLAHRTAQAAERAAQAVNPVNPDNVAYAGVNAIGRALSGREDWSLGVWLYEITHPEEDSP